MASTIAHAMEEHFHVERHVKDPDRAAIDSAFHIDRAITAKLLAGRGTCMYGLALLTWNPKERLARSHLLLDRSIELAPDDANTLCAEAIVCLLENDTATSREWWKKAFAVDAKLARRRLGNSDVRLLLKQQGIEEPRSMYE
jgi:hypothetical protein